MNRSILFIILTFAISWLIALVYYLLGGEWNTRLSTAVALAIMFIPMLVAIFMKKVIEKKPLIKSLRISWKMNYWWLVAIFLPLIWALSSFGINLLFPGVEFTPDMSGLMGRLQGTMSPEDFQKMQDQIKDTRIHPFLLGVIQALVFGPTFNAVAGFGEELGWRGYLLQKMDNLGFWKVSLYIGLVWGIWHAPLILQGHNYPEFPVLGVGLMTLWCILLTPTFVLVTIRSGSVIPAAILHGTVNASAGLSFMFVSGGSEWLNGIMGISGFVILILTNLAIRIFYKSPETGSTGENAA